MNPIHFLPFRMRAVAVIAFGTCWLVLFAYGTIRLAFEREWLSAAVTGAITAFFAWGIHHTLRRWRAERAAEAAVEAGPRSAQPIE